MDAGAGVALYLLDDLVRVPVKRSPGRRSINGPADPRLDTERRLERFSVAQLVYRHDGGMGRFRRQPEAVPSVAEHCRALQRSLAAASNDYRQSDFGSPRKQRTRVGDVLSVELGPLIFEQLPQCRDVLI